MIYYMHGHGHASISLLPVSLVCFPSSLLAPSACCFLSSNGFSVLSLVLSAHARSYKLSLRVANSFSTHFFQRFNIYMQTLFQFSFNFNIIPGYMHQAPETYWSCPCLFQNLHDMLHSFI